MRACYSDGHFSILAEAETIPVLLPYVYMSMVSSYTVIYVLSASMCFRMSRQCHKEAFHVCRLLAMGLRVDGENAEL